MTVKWELLADDLARQVWDQSLVKFSDFSPFQTYAWGEYNRSLGWQPYRWAAFDGKGQVVAMMQGLLRRYPFGFGLVWSAGGPVGDLSAWNEDLQQAVVKSTGVKRLYCRFRSDRPRQVEDVLRLAGQGWARSWYTLTSNLSLELDLTTDDQALLAGCSRNWRRNLRRAAENKLVIKPWPDPDVDEMLSAYASMQSFKNLEEQVSRRELEQTLNHFRQRVVLYRCDDGQGNLVGLRGCAILGNRAWDLFAATAQRGRELCASYPLFWALVRHCRSHGVRSYDLGGIDPVQNPGVYRFKEGTGASPLEYLGEWDWANATWLRWAGNWAIWQRSRIRQRASQRATRKLWQGLGAKLNPFTYRRKQQAPDSGMTEEATSTLS